MNTLCMLLIVKHILRNLKLMMLDHFEHQLAASDKDGSTANTLLPTLPAIFWLYCPLLPPTPPLLLCPHLKKPNHP